MVDVEHYDTLVAQVAYEFSRKYRMVEVDDVRQQLWLWFYEHPRKVDLWHTLDKKDTVKLIARSLRNAAKDYCQKEKAKATGYNVEDLYYYDKELLERLLPSVISGDRTAPSLNDLGYTNNKKVASEGNNWFAMVADIEKAMSKLPEEQYDIIFMRYGDDCTVDTLAKTLSVSVDAARMRVNRAINNLMNYLGGKRPRMERDYTEEEENDARKAIADHDANSATDNREDGSEDQGLDVDEGTGEE